MSQHAANLAVLLLAAVLVACGEPATSVGPGGGGEDTASAVLASHLGARAYVALPPSAVPGAKRAVVRGSGDSARAVALNGGFDPVSFVASEGETVVVAVTDSAGRVTESSVKVAPRPPRVVRTSPGERRTDVPLNARVLVVFSVPMDSASTGARVRLLRAGGAVPGRVELGVNGTVAEFVPAQPLASLTDYTLVVDGAVTDVRGTPMGEPVSAAFTTGSSVGTVAAIGILVWDGDCDVFVTTPCGANALVPGKRFLVSPQLFDARGQTLLATLPVAWRSSDERVARLSPVDYNMFPGDAFVGVEVRGFGTATLQATVAGLTASLELHVTPLVPLDRLGTLAVLEAVVDNQSDALWRVPLDGSGARRLAAVSELPPDPGCEDEWSCPVRHAYAVALGGRIAIARASAAGGVWVKDDETAPPRAVHPAGARGAARVPAWSPDGLTLAYWFDRPDLGETELRIVGADGSGERVLRRIPLASGTDSPLQWHPDGQRLLVSSPEGTEALPLDGSPSSLYLAGWLPGPWLPDGRTQIVYGRGNFGPDVVPAYEWALAVDGVVQASSATTLGLPLGVAPDVGLVAYANGVAVRSTGTWVYLPRLYGRFLGFAP